MSALPAPYYSDDAVTIFHGDALELLPLLPRVDAVVTDPPYGIAGKWSGVVTKKWHSDLIRDFAEWDVETKPAELFAAIEMAGESIVWGGNYYYLPPSRGFLVWDKVQKFTSADSELAWCSEPITPRTFRMSRVSAYTSKRDLKEHPTQKPIALMHWCLGFLKSEGTILDPFMGSGTTLRAAKDLGRKAIGIELEEKYCEVAAKRMQQEVLPFNEPKQDAMEEYRQAEWEMPE